MTTAIVTAILEGDGIPYSFLEKLQKVDKNLSGKNEKKKKVTVIVENQEILKRVASPIFLKKS